MEVENGKLTKVTEEDLELLEKNPDEFWKGVNAIGNYAFKDCQEIKNIDIPKSVKEIEMFAFWRCFNLKKIVLSEGLEIIGIGAFYECPEIKTIVIPNSVKTIEFKVFMGCNKLKKIVFKNRKSLQKKSWDAKEMLDGFYFDSIQIKGDSVTFVRNIEKVNDEEKE